MFNVLVTLAILVRLDVSRRRLTKTLGHNHLLRQYTDGFAMITESGAVFSAFTLVVVAAYATNSTALELLLPLASQVQVCVFMSHPGIVTLTGGKHRFHQHC